LKKLAIIFTLFCALTVSFAAEENALLQIEEIPPQEIAAAPQQNEHDPLFVTSLSLVPGLGQVVMGNYARGTFFFTTSGIIGWIGAQAWWDYRRSYQRIYDHRDSLANHRARLTLSENADSAARVTMILANRVALAEYDNLLEKTRYHNAAFMLGAVGIWNLLDAFGVSANMQGAQNPAPRRAMALSAIPFTGAGQFYNGEWFKGGLVFATQTSFVFGGARFQYLMYKAQQFPRELGEDENFALLPINERVDLWRNNHRNAAQRRTMFFWYFVISYIYGMTDAFVDASLSGFDRKFDLTFDYLPQNEEISLGFVWNFGGRGRSGF